MSKGLGDKVANFTKATGIDKVAKAVLGDNCGCEERQKKLNAMFPNLKAQMNENEYVIWGRLKGSARGQISSDVNESIRQLYNSVFNANEKPTTCGSCVRRRVEKLNAVYENTCIEG